jgi:hypothetical protein
MIDLAAAIARLDSLATWARDIAGRARQEHWPSLVITEAERLSRTLAEHAGALDTADDRPSAGAALKHAREVLPAAFGAFGRAVAEELGGGTKLRTWRKRRPSEGGR